MRLDERRGGVTIETEPKLTANYGSALAPAAPVVTHFALKLVGGIKDVPAEGTNAGLTALSYSG